jgi:RNA polymerase sigma factor (sigma-70 family)
VIAAIRLHFHALHHVPCASGPCLPRPKDDPRIAQYLPLCQAMARRYLHKMAGQHDFEDLVSFGLEAVWRATQSHDDGGVASFGTYVTTCVRNALEHERLRVWRHRRRTWINQVSIHPASEDDAGIDLPTDFPSPFALLSAAQEHRAVHAALAKLKPRYQMVLRRIYVNETDGVDVARADAVSRQAVQQLSADALRELGRKLTLHRGDAKVFLDDLVPAKHNPPGPRATLTTATTRGRVVSKRRE